MAKKKLPQAVKPKEFGRSPFNPLKGFAVSEPSPAQKVEQTVPAEKVEEIYGSFAEEMAMLDVKRLDSSAEEDDSADLESQSPLRQQPQPAAPQNEEEEFLLAVGELEVRFSDQVPAVDQPPAASARRMKQLKQGKLIPEASLDLHGLLRTAVEEKLRFFLQDAQHHGWLTLLVITGKGLHSEGGEPVLRNAAERFLATEGRKAVAEWGRAPKQYGGDGALVLFLRK